MLLLRTLTDLFYVILYGDPDPPFFVNSAGDPDPPLEIILGIEATDPDI